MTEIDDGVQSNADLSLERVVAGRLHAFSNMITGAFYQRTEQPLGVSLPEWRVLRSVLLTPGVSQGEIAADQGLNVMNVSRAVAGLRRKGLIEVQPDPDDRRRTMLTPSSLGEDVGHDIHQRERLVYEHVFSELSPDELDHLGHMMGRVNKLLRDDGLPEPPPPVKDWASLLNQSGDS